MTLIKGYWALGYPYRPERPSRLTLVNSLIKESALHRFLPMASIVL